jgi:hypothetical protein
MAKEPPEPLGAAHAPVRDDEDAVTDPCPLGDGGESLRARQRMPSLTLDRQVREILVDVEKRRSWDVAFEVELAATSGVPELPAAVDESVGEGNG